MHRFWFTIALALLACGPKPPPRVAPPLRRDVTLLDVRLALKQGSGADVLADDLPKDVLHGDTVWVYPVVRLVVGEKQTDTMYLANTQKIGRIGRDGDTAKSGWPIGKRLNVWSKLKSDIAVEWYQVRPLKACFRPNEPVQFLRAPLNRQSWYQELTGPVGCRRFVVQVSYGSQIVVSGTVSSEESVLRIPWVSFRPDSTNVGWTMPLLGGVPFHDGSSDQQTAAFISCDDRTLLTSGLARIGYSLGAGSTPDEIDSAGRIMFQGYIRYGRLYDEEGRRAVVSLGRDLRRGDVIHFTTLGQYGIVADDSPRSGWSYGGIPAGLPVIQALSSYPQIRPFYAALWSLRTLFGKSNLKILRYEAIPRPAFPKVKPKSARRPSVGKKPAPAIPKTPPKSGISQKGK